MIQQVAIAPIYSIGSRGDIWCDECSILHKEFRSHFLQSYAALPSSTHIAESNVKDANYCQIKGRADALASAYSTARSDLVEPINRLAKLEFDKKDKYAGNGSVSGGTKETRMRKAENTNYMEASVDSRVLSVRGRIKTSEAVRYIRSRHRSIQLSFDETPAKLAAWKRIHEHVADKENQFAEQRVAVKLEEYEKNKHNNKPKNRLQNRTGIFQTPLVLGRIRYSKLKKDRDLGDIKKELECRGLDTSGAWKNGLIPRLKTDEGDQKSFKPRHPDLVDTMFDKIVSADLGRNE